MSAKYDAVATRALATIKAKGAPVVFHVEGSAATGDIYDPLTDTWSPGPASTSGTVTGQAVQIDGDPDRFAALNLVLKNPVTLLVAAKGLGIRLAPGIQMDWAGVRYTIKDADDTGPDGDPILWTVTGSQ